jgi:hypothetical protein
MSEAYPTTDLDQCHRVLDDWFEEGLFSGSTSVALIAAQLRMSHPEFCLTFQGAKSVVRTWMACARDLGEID